MYVLVHLGLALFFKVTLARCEPHEYCVGVTFAIFVHKVGENNGLAAARGTFQHDVALAVGHRLH